MSDLLKWQTVSFISRGLAVALGLVQSLFIVRILSVSEYGLVSIVVSIGSAFGIYQHLGLASGSTREISAAKDDSEIFKIFVTSVVIRYLVSIPLAVGLWFLSDYLAVEKYGNASIIFPLKLFAMVLLIQGFQSIFNSVISGMQRFKRLFIYQVVIAAVSLFIYIPLIYLYRVNGYFYALLAFNFVASLCLGFLALKPLRGKFTFPSKEDFHRLFKDILSISLGIYAVKIIYTYWQKSGPLLLGLSVSPEQVGIFSFALLYAGKLMVVSDAVTDVNLPVLSKKFVENIDEFKETFSSNFDKIFALIIFIAVSAVFWLREVVLIFVGSSKYDEALPFVLPLVCAFILYSIVNIVKSSIIIPAKLVKELILSFVLMLAGTVGFYFAFLGTFGRLGAMAYGMPLGALLGVLYTMFVSWSRLKLSFLDLRHWLLLGLAVAAGVFQFEFSIKKILAYLLFCGIFLGLSHAFDFVIIKRKK